MSALKNLDKDVYFMLASIGIKQRLKSYVHIRNFINDYFNDIERMNSLNICEWYEIESNRTGCSAYRVERNIRHSVNFVKNNKNDLVKRIFGKDNYTNKGFLFALCRYLEITEEK